MTNLWVGERVRLRALEPGDADTFATVFDADTDGMRAGGRIFPPRSTWAVGEWIAQATQESNDGDEFRVGIEAVDTGELVGMLTTQRCDPVAGTCSYGVAVWPWARRRGYAGETVVIVLRYLFGERRYQKCTVGAYEFNEGSVAFHHALGFRTEGAVRRAHFAGGRHWDELVLGITTEEFAERWGLGRTAAP